MVTLSTLVFGGRASAQNCALRVNALATVVGVVDLGVELSVAENWSLELSSQIGVVDVTGRVESLYSVGFGAKYWLFESYVGPFVGPQLIYTSYDIEQSQIIYGGHAVGLGLSCGYSWILSPRWSVVGELGLGLFYNRDCGRELIYDDWGDEHIYTSSRLTLAPSRLSISFNYLF